VIGSQADFLQVLKKIIQAMFAVGSGDGITLYPLFLLVPVIRVNCLAERKEKLVAIVFELQINQ
jgi:hypothetical protein